jgi:glutamyl-tRNA synthetase
LGWSHGDQEEFTREELIEKFSLDAVGKSAAAINPGKLDWLNSQYIKRMDLDELSLLVRPFFEAKGYPMKDSVVLRKVVLSLRDRVKTLVEMADLAKFYFTEEITYDEKAADKFLNRKTAPMLETICSSLSQETTLNKERCHQLIQQLAETEGVPLVNVAQPLRVALTGKTVSPPMDEVMDALGKEEVLKRVGKAIDYIKNH